MGIIQYFFYVVGELGLRLNEYDAVMFSLFIEKRNFTEKHNRSQFRV